MNKAERLRQIDLIMDTQDLSTEEFDVLNKEANLLIVEINALKSISVNEAKKALVEMQLRILELYKEGKMVQVVEEYGHEFVGDYEITSDFTVISYCTQRNPDRDGKWPQESFEDAQAKIFDLVYWRVYEKYIRGINKLQ